MHPLVENTAKRLTQEEKDAFLKGKRVIRKINTVSPYENLQSIAINLEEVDEITIGYRDYMSSISGKAMSIIFREYGMVDGNVHFEFLENCIPSTRDERIKFWENDLPEYK